MLWSTSMEIPVGAPNPQAAQAFINFVYDPKVQADIAEWVNYVTPVAGVKGILRKRDPELARNQLIFPSKSYTAELQLRAGARRRARPGGHRGIPAGDPADRSANAVDRRRCRPRRSRRSRRDARAARRAGPGVRGVAPHAQLLIFPELHLSAPAPAPARAARPCRAAWRWRSPARSPGGSGEIARAARHLARARLGLRARRGRRDPQHRLGRLSRPGSWWRATARCSRGSRTRPALPGDEFVTFDIPGGRPDRSGDLLRRQLPRDFRQLAWMGAEVVLQSSLTTTSDRGAGDRHGASERDLQPALRGLAQRAAPARASGEA